MRSKRQVNIYNEQGKIYNEQIARLNRIFPDGHTCMTVYADGILSKQIKYTYRVSREKKHGLVLSDVNKAVDSLLSVLKITKVQEYIMVNRHRLGGML